MAWIKEHTINTTSFGDYWALSTIFSADVEADFIWNIEQGRFWNLSSEQWSKELIGTAGDVVVWTYTAPIWSDTTLWTTTAWIKES